jgi:membrane protein YdbS with pleckstrin-like domain
MFENPEIAQEDLPKAADVTWLPMDQKFLRRLMAQSAITVVVIVTAAAAFSAFLKFLLMDENPDVSFGTMWAIIPLVAIPLFLWPVISVPRIAYAVRDKDILYKAGVFWQTVTTIPFNRIQHVEKSSTPLDRRFDIATLQLFTAGGAGGDLKVHGLSASTAEDLRVFIIEKVGTSVEHS